MKDTIYSPLAIGTKVKVKWATPDYDEYIYEYGMIVGFFLDRENVLKYKVRFHEKDKEVPHYQVIEL